MHPFREGNGRLARLLADVMAVQAGCGTLDYSSWETTGMPILRRFGKGWIALPADDELD